ncbi:hypothetical protein WDU99_01795 [Microbacterium sp. Mu-80]|uniref:Uncharacterized protein n=1 Tax=Microbacterium bandirmense TaxID=3122050 RepID=A0ABU8L7L0_9MICO
MNLTTLLDLVGSLLVIAALAVFVAMFTLAGGLAVAGVGLLALSWLIDRQAAGRGREQR